MSKLVDVEGVGLIDFPDDFTPEDISGAIERDILPKYQKQTTIKATPLEAPVADGFPYPAGLSPGLPMGGSTLLSPDEAAAQNPPDTSFGAALGSSLAGGAIKSVAGVSNAIGRNLVKTNEEEASKLQAQLAELEQNSQGNDYFAQRSREEAQKVRNKLQTLQRTPESPLTGPIREELGGFAKNLQGFNEDVIQPYYGANPESKNLGAQIGRGLGGFVNAAPLMALGGVGLVAGAGQMASVAYQDQYEKVLKETGDPAQAATEAGKAAEKTGPALLAYAVGGKLAGAGAAKLLDSAVAGKILGEAAKAPLTKAAVGTVAATTSNVATGSIIRGLEGQDWGPTAENLTMDALFGLVHGYGEYSKASQEARQRASEELKARGVPEEAATPTEEAGKATSDAPPTNREDIWAGVRDVLQRGGTLDDLELLADRLEALQSKGKKLSWESIPTDLQNKIGTGERESIIRALDQDPDRAIERIREMVARESGGEVKGPDLSKFGNKVDVEAGVAQTPSGNIDLATGEKLDPIREQSLKSLGKLQEEAPSEAQASRDLSHPFIGETGTATPRGFVPKGDQGGKKLMKVEWGPKTRGGSETIVMAFDDGTSVSSNAGLQSDGTYISPSSVIEANFKPERAPSSLDVSLEPVSAETFKREFGSDLLDDHIALRDPVSKQVVQVPVDAKPEQVAETVKAARAEEEAAVARAQQDEAAAVEERAFIEKARALNAEDALRRMEEFKAQGAGVDPSTIKARKTAIPEEERRAAIMEERKDEMVWNNPLRLRNLRNEMTAKRRKDPSYGGSEEKFRASIQEIDDRFNKLMSGELDPERPSPDITPTRDGTVQPVEELPPNQAPGASSIGELQTQQAVAGADIHKGLRESTGEAPSKELWEKNFLREYPEREGDREFIDRAYRISVRADEQQQAAPGKPMPEVVRQLDKPIPTEEATSIKNATVDKERQERNLPPAMEAGKREFGQVWDEAVRSLDSDPQRQFLLIEELARKPRPVTDEENALLLHRQITLQNEYDKNLKDLNAAYQLDAEAGRPEFVEEVRNRLSVLSDELTKLYTINKEVGTEQGRGLAARKMMAMEDFSPAKMEASMAFEKGERLSPEEQVQVREMAAKIKSTEDAFEAYRVQMEERIANLEAQKQVVKIVERVKKESAPKAAKPSNLEKATNWLKSKADQARENIRIRREKGGLFSGGIDPGEIDDYAIIGASHIASGLNTFAKWSAAMIQEFGENIRPYLNGIFKKSQDALKEAPKQMTQEEQRTRILDGMKRRVADGDDASALGPYIQKLAENAVRAGIREVQPLVAGVHEVVKDIIPGITPREVRDAISGYGKFKQLSQEEAKVILRDLKGQSQQISKIEDLQAKIPPKKTGVERREPSAAERQLIKEVNELKKKGGFTVTDPATQLKTSLDAIKTRLRNHIQDIELALSTKTPIPTKKGGVPYDTEANVLKAQRDALKEQYDSIFQKPGLTEEQRVQMAKGALERSIKEYEDRIKNGELARKAKRPAPSTPELQSMRAERDALRAELDALRAADSQIQEQRAQEGLTKSVADLENKLKNGEPPKAQKQGPDSEAVAKLKARREALQKQLEAVRAASPETRKRQIEATVQSLENSIKEYDRRLQQSDFSNRTTKAPLSTPEIDSLRSELDAMQRLYNELRNAQKPKLSPEEVALKAAKARLKTQTAQYERRLAAGDLEPKPRREIKPDTEFLKLKADNTLAKEEFLKARFEARLKARPAWKKFVGGIGETLNTSRAVLTAFDLSAVLRQGGFIALGNPVRAAKAIGPMFRALRSERNQQAVMEAIKADPNYDLAQRSKLFLSDNEALSLTKMEEAYASRWASKIPGVGASGRAYNTFLNKLRMDTFNSMVETLTKTGTPTPEEAKAIANYINVATGRGSIHQSLAQATSGLNMVFFAPRYVTSRFQLLLGQPFYGGTARTRTLVAKEYAKMLAGAATVYGLTVAAGASRGTKDEWDRFTDPTSSEFMKLKFGNTRVDLLFGLQQASVLMSREISGKSTNNKGVVQDLWKKKKGPNDPNPLTVAGRFLRTKLAPVPGTIYSLADDNKDLAGNYFGPKEAVLNSVVPISFGDIYKVMKEQGVPAGTAFTILSMFGAGVQTYDQKQSTSSGRSSRDPLSERSSMKDPLSKGL